MRYQATRAKAPAHEKKAFARNAILATATAACAGMLADPAYAGGTPAGSSISNVATATYDLPTGQQASVDSNTVTIKVDELLDVTVGWRDPADVVTRPGLTGQLLSFTVTNGGNGTESFTLGTVSNGGGDDFDPNVTSIILDSNGNGAFDAGVDTVYVPGANDPSLAPDQSVVIFVFSTIPGGAADGNRAHVDLTAVANTGTGTPGTSFAGLGQGGGNAVVGATGAKGQDDGWYKVESTSVSFVKSASVADPFGGTTQGPGAIVTYTLTATVNGTGSLSNLRIADPIPAGTTYKPGSLTLDAAPLTDAADLDAGSFGANAVAVALGTVAAGTVKTVTFQVKID
jgi:uncharacterized repeat protein (TIGR01451 family)